MVSCTQCINDGVVCYYDRSQSAKCAECLRRQQHYDGTFALEEYRRVGDLKKQLLEKSRQKRREMQRLRKTLMNARQQLADAQRTLGDAEKAVGDVEAEDNDLQNSIAELEDRSSRMIQREMQALGVVNSLDTEQGIVLGDPDFVWSEIPVTETTDWSEVFQGIGDIPSETPG
jgi:hypothetical protein